MGSKPLPMLNTGIINRYPQLGSGNTAAPAMDSIINSSNLTYRGLLATLQALHRRSNGRLFSVPMEILDRVCGYVHTRSLSVAPHQHTSPLFAHGPHPALAPPASGVSKLLDLPIEVREKIFSRWLPEPEVTIEPLCEEVQDRKSPTRKAKPNKTSDFMVLNKKIKEEITHMIYEERSFKIHVHQDLDEGGIEFLDAGRQPLQYQDNVSDSRFVRFGNGEEFGFSRLKKIEIAIFSATGDTKHCAMNAYYQNLALVKLLERGAGEKNQNRINSIIITFPKSHSDAQAAQATTRQGIMRGEYFWWDPEAGEPRSTSTFGVPDIEFVLRPFANLRSHSVSIVLPHGVNEDDKTLQFVARLEDCMKHGHLLDTNEEDFEMHMNIQRAAFEDYLFNRKLGSKSGDYKWTERAWMQSDGHGGLKRRKVRQEDDTTEEDTHVPIPDEDFEEQKALPLAPSEKPKLKKCIVSGLGRRLGHETVSKMTGNSGNSLLASLAAERARRSSYRSSLDDDEGLVPS